MQWNSHSSADWDQELPGLRTFVAIDFETANRSFRSACSLGMVRVDDGQVVSRERYLIRPPSSRFEFTSVHGIAWTDVQNAPVFSVVWERAQQLLEGASFVAAHNAVFDQSVLHSCCRAHHLSEPKLPFICTLHLARRTWDLHSASLPVVCKFLNIPLRHHDPLSDAEACARIVLLAQSHEQCREHDL